MKIVVEALWADGCLMHARYCDMAVFSLLRMTVFLQ